LLGNIGCKGVDREPYYLGAREIKFLSIASNSVWRRKAPMGGRGGDRGDDQAVRALRGAHRAGMAGRGRRAPDQGHSYFDAHWEKKAAQVAAWERSTFARDSSSTRRSVCITRCRLNVEESRGDLHPRGAGDGASSNPGARSSRTTRKLIADIEALEHKARRPDVVVTTTDLAFYDERNSGGHP